MEQNKLEILLETQIGNEKPSLETIIEILSQFAKCSITVRNHYKKKVNEPEGDIENLIDNVIGFSSWDFLSHTLAVTGIAFCQKTPEAVIELTEFMNNFAKKWGDDVKESQNKKEETFFKENPDLN